MALKEQSITHTQQLPKIINIEYYECGWCGKQSSFSFSYVTYVYCIWLALAAGIIIIFDGRTYVRKCDQASQMLFDSRFLYVEGVSNHSFGATKITLITLANSAVYGMSISS